jgi:hypothetical protein
METQKLIARHTYSDHQLVELAIAENQQAYRALFKRYWKPVFFFLFFTQFC